METASLITDMGVADQIFLYRQGLPEAVRTHLIGRIDTLVTLQLNMEAAIRFEASRSNALGTAPPQQARAGYQGRFPPRQGQSSVHQMEDQGPQEEESVQNQVTRLVQEQINLIQSGRPAVGGGGKERSGFVPGLAPGLANARINSRLCVKCGSGTHFKRECTAKADLTTFPPK
jgi:hypothetical protein